MPPEYTLKEDTVGWFILFAWLAVAIGMVSLGDKLTNPAMTSIGAAMVLMLAAVAGVISS